MAESTGKGKRTSGPGWLATLLGAMVLVVLGFGLGLVTGAAYEEPKLVAEHLAGRTVNVALPTEVAPPQAAPAPAARPEPAPSPAAAPPAPLGREPLRAAAPPPNRASPPNRAAPANRASAPEQARRPTPPPVAAAPAPNKDGYRIQVGAFGDIEGARKLRNELRAAGHPTEIQERGTGARFKVRVGPLRTRAEAEGLAKQLEARRKLPTWILAPGRG